MAATPRQSYIMNFMGKYLNIVFSTTLLHFLGNWSFVTPSYLGNGKIYNKYVAIFHSRVFPRY
jgi:hypothetical protein